MGNRNISGNEGSKKTLYYPTQEACDAFNITRTTLSKQNKTTEDSIGFLQGSQFKTNVFANDAKSIRKNTFKKTSTQTDPSNSFITKNILDEVCLEFIGNAPTTINYETKNGISIPKLEEQQTKEPYLIINIAPNSTEWMNFSHDHDWESGGGVLQGVLEMLSQVGQAASDFGTFLTNVEQNSNLGGNQNYQANKITKTEFTATYKGSSPTQLTIPFTLFTPGGEIQDFIRDIYYPIMILNFLSYPRRLKTLTPEETAEVNDKLRSSQGNNSSVRDGGNNKGYAESGADKLNEGMRSGTNFINQNLPGSRLSILEPPSYIRVTHSSGLFRFPACAITNFTYNYKAPWVSMNKDVVKMPEYSAFTKDSQFMKRGFPCIAECSLTIRSVDPLYADDWANMFNISDVVVVSKDKSSEGAIETYRKNQEEQDKSYNEAIENNRFGAGVRFSSNIGVNIGFRGSL